MSETLKDYKIREAFEAARAAQRLVVERINEMVHDIRDERDMPSYKGRSILPVANVEGVTGVVIFGKRSDGLFPRFEIMLKKGWSIDPNEAHLNTLAELSLSLSKILIGK
jgi:hypothetical protein